jgi:hypothetical protein
MRRWHAVWRAAGLPTLCAQFFASRVRRYLSMRRVNPGRPANEWQGRLREATGRRVRCTLRKTFVECLSCFSSAAEYSIERRLFLTGQSPLGSQAHFFGVVGSWETGEKQPSAARSRTKDSRSTTTLKLRGPREKTLRYFDLERQMHRLAQCIAEASSVQLD